MRILLRSWRGRLLLTVPVFAVLAGFVLHHLLFRSRLPEERQVVTLLVPVGAGVTEIGRRCEELGIIEDIRKFSFLAKVTGLDRELKAGKYQFRQGESVLRVLDALAAGATANDRVVIPEGSTSFGISKILKDEIGLSQQEFLSLVRNAALSKELGVEALNLEGYLYPDSYQFAVGMDPEQVIRIMLRRFSEILGEPERRRVEELGFTVHQIVTLASMVEKEARMDEERPLIAAVYYNRLEKGRLLQCDATVLYALAEHKDRVLYNDLQVQSPYNTYLHKGLPPGPICSPGRSSILAVLYPAEVDYLYYVARGDGSHIFSRTEKEHQEAKRTARRYQLTRDRG